MSLPATVEFEPKKKLCLSWFLRAVLLLSPALFIGSALLITDYKDKFLGWTSVDVVKEKSLNACQIQHRPYGSETLPRGIVSATSDLERRQLFGHHEKNLKKPSNILAMAVGIKQKKNVDKIIKKFLSSDNDFVLMLFHYDGVVDEWRDLEWSSRAIHIAAVNQTKWWFAKRFLHPDIVSEYDYIFLWDEDLGIDNFHPGRYLSIIKEEGLEISQPALDPKKSEVHHQLTKRCNGSRVHRRINKQIGISRCDKNVTGPPCSGFVEMMAPVFSKASWRCTWYMIQNDLVHGWGVDFQLGYCAQGDPTKNVGIVDSEYIIHYGLPTLGGSATDKAQLLSKQPQTTRTVKKWSFVELDIFKNRWRNAAKSDDCWTDMYKPNQKTG
ncbi:uncharacterized protein LOC8259717 isoform X2 [Ricinus communis]|uniref:uncharacterized protein LOC8259717 isoform X2 n=1 Tax=Ricinus communis TaxID=3988 RepID=UPI0007724C4D|nr:uncharacterized protein LOC8259717 isoform X2 [Ricinus communis]|eukprot:XP_015579732.1 uncharacterized protein LOC8259717 isoform X2 [Ricinus communis]